MAFKRLSGSFLKRCLGIDWNELKDNGGSVPADYRYAQTHGIVIEDGGKVTIQPDLPIAPTTTTTVVVNPALEGALTYMFIVEPEDEISVTIDPESAVEVAYLPWLFRFYVEA